MKSVLLLLSCAAIGAAETTVFDNFTLIDVKTGKTLAQQSMVVTDGRITAIGAASKIKAPTGAQRTDLAGRYVMPGIVNLHGHLGNTVDLVQDPKNFTRANLDKQLKMYAAFGVTTIVSMGSEQPLIITVRDEQRATGRPSGARVYTALRGFTGIAGYPTSAPGMKGVPYEVGTKEQVEKDLDELAAKKVDLVKIWVDDHLGKEKKIPLELCDAIIAGAHKRGLKVAAHIFYLADAKHLINSGLDAIVHSVRDKPVDQELIALMKKKGAWLGAATLAREASTFVFANAPAMLDDPLFQKAVSPAVLKTLQSKAFQDRAKAEPDTAHGKDWLTMAQKNLKTLVDAGVQTGFGTDSGPPRRIQGYNEHWEMEMMAESGLKPAQILKMATINSAEFLRGSKDFGSIEPGKWADMIVLRDNPLTAIKNTRTIESVYIAGSKVN